MLTNGFWCYIGTPLPASNNDINLFDKEEKYIKKKIWDQEDQDLIIADTIFKSLATRINLVAGCKREFGQVELEAWKSQENWEIGDTRGYLERRLGHVKNAFTFMVTKSRERDKKQIKSILKIIFALDNIKTFPALISNKILKMKSHEWEEFLNVRKKWSNPNHYESLFEDVSNI